MLAVPKGRSQVKKVFGDPELRGGGENMAWVKDNLVSVPLPYVMRYAYNTATKITHCRFHHLIADNLKGAFQEVWDTARVEMKKKHGYNQTSDFYDSKTRAYLRLLGLDLFGGTYIYRKKRGTVGLSMHAYGIAIDINPTKNPMGKKGVMPDWFVAIFVKWGFTWGGTWKRRDDMHFQYANGV